MAIKYPSEIIREAALLSPRDPPRPNKIGLLLLDAMRVYCPEEWTRWTDAFHFPRHPPGHAKNSQDEMAAFFTCWDTLKAQLLSGEVVATGFLSSPRAETFDPGAWRAFSPRSHFDIAQSLVRRGDVVVRGVLVRRMARPRTTAAVVAACTQWFRTRMKRGPVPGSKRAMYKEARQEIGDDLSERQFFAIWNKLAPASWRTPGAKPLTKRPSKARQSKR